MSAPASSVSLAALTVAEARAAVRAACRPLPTETVALDLALDRVLQAAVLASEDMPAFDRSAVDGFAVRQDDVGDAFCVVDEIRAGEWKPCDLKPGEAVRIATGGALPGAGLQVIMQEQTLRQGDHLTVRQRDAVPNIRFRGEDWARGQTVVPAGTRLRPGHLALLASVGHAHPRVTRLPRILHWATGNEIIPPGTPLRPGQIYDTNSTLIRALLAERGLAVAQTRVPEDFDAACQAWAAADGQSDLTLISGGASVGQHDFTRRLLEHFGYRVIFAQTKARPGKPLVFATRGASLAFGLPGNPLAHFVCFHLYVSLALALLAGLPAPAEFARGILADDLEPAPVPSEMLWPAAVFLQGGRVRVRPLPWKSSGDITCLARANALFRMAPGEAAMPAGTEVEFLPTSASEFSENVL